MHGKILVIDDYPDAGKMLAMALETMGHEVEWAKDGPSALKKIQKFVPDVVMCDICMPGMLGYDVCTRMKADPRLKDTLFIAQTAIDSDIGKERALKAGFTHHMIKPVDTDALAVIISKQCSRQATQIPA